MAFSRMQSKGAVIVLLVLLLLWLIRLVAAA